MCIQKTVFTLVVRAFGCAVKTKAPGNSRCTNEIHTCLQSSPPVVTPSPHPTNTRVVIIVAREQGREEGRKEGRATFGEHHHLPGATRKKLKPFQSFFVHDGYEHYHQIKVCPPPPLSPVYPVFQYITRKGVTKRTNNASSASIVGSFSFAVH